MIDGEIGERQSQISELERRLHLNQQTVRIGQRLIDRSEVISCREREGVCAIGKRGNMDCSMRIAHVGVRATVDVPELMTIAPPPETGVAVRV